MDTSEKSWGELLQSHLRRRNELQWNKEQQKPVKYVTRYDMSRKERLFDPVLQTYRDREQEDRACSREREIEHRRLNRSKVQQLGKLQSYDVINHKSVVPGSKPEKGSREYRPTKKPSSGYNIISNLDNADHHYDRPANRPTRLPDQSRKDESRQIRGDFDIISNRYRDKHDEKIRVDQTQRKEMAAVKYWETHDFDPVSCRFYETKKEEKFQELRTRMNKDHGKDFLNRLPPSTKDSEGMLCNIISMEAKDPERLYRYDRKHKKAPREINPRASMERSQQEHAILKQRLDETRSLNRGEPKRHNQLHSYEHGYDIVNTKPFVGRNGIHRPVSDTRTRKSLWNKLERQQQLQPTSIGNQEQDQLQNSIKHERVQKTHSTKRVTTSSTPRSIRTSGFS